MNKIAISLAAGMLVFMGGFLVGFGKSDLEWQRLAVQHGAAHYDSMTAEFVWNDGGK